MARRAFSEGPFGTPEISMRPTVTASAFILFFAGLMSAQAIAQTIGAVGQEALETGRSGTVFTWRDPDDGASGSFVPRPAFQDASGRICRAFDQTVMIGGRPQQVWGTACRRSDGWWELRSADADGPPPGPRLVPAPAAVIVHAPPPVVYEYRPVYRAPPYGHVRPPYRSSIHIHVGPHSHHPRYRRW